MRALLAPNAFKGSLTAQSAGEAMARGARVAGVQADLCPIADGGDGTLDILRRPLRLTVRWAKVLGPLGRPVRARWGFNRPKRLAVIEMAQASGLALLKAQDRDPLKTSSYGTGQLIQAALRSGAREILVGLGGSATVEGGMGILQALGARVSVWRQGQKFVLNRPATGADLSSLHSIDLEKVRERLNGVHLRVLCDVRNPLLGPRGAARVFGPQKGAIPSAVRRLENGLAVFSRLVRFSDRNPPDWAGSGAAGGAAAGLVGLAGGTKESGVEYLFRLLRVEERIKRVDLVLTGEGRVDRTTWEGKAVGGLARLCRQHKKPLFLLAGGIGPGTKRPGITLVPLGSAEMSRRVKVRTAGRLLEQATAGVLGKAMEGR